MNFIFIVLISTLITIFAGTQVIISNSINIPHFSSPTVSKSSVLNIQNNQTLSVEKKEIDWQLFENNFHGYKLKHYNDVSLKNTRGGDILIERPNSIYILISQKSISKNYDLTKTIESDIFTKTNNKSFLLLNNISPISIGLVTAQTFSSQENNELISYYYIPQKNNKYLLIKNKTPLSREEEYLRSEDIIFSIELTP